MCRAAAHRARGRQLGTPVAYTGEGRHPDPQEIQRAHIIVSLEVALQRAAGRPFALTAAQRRQLAVLGLSDPSLEVQEMERS